MRKSYDSVVVTGDDHQDDVSPTNHHRPASKRIIDADSMEHDAVHNEIYTTLSRYSFGPRRVLQLCGAVNLVLLLIIVVLSRNILLYQQPNATVALETLSVLNISRPHWKSLPRSEQELTKIAFGSCSSQNMPQPYWDTLHSYEPDVLLLMGDNVYGDCLPLQQQEQLNPSSEEILNACQPLIQAYRDFAGHPSARGAFAAIPIFATLDDHDYGVSSAHNDNPYKHLAKDLFVEFFGIDKQEVQDRDGVYRSRVWGTEGRRLQVIQLDTRFAKSPFVRTGNKSSPFVPYDDEAVDSYQMLSPRQWSWLRDQLTVEADLRLIVSSIQVLNDVAGFECWRHMPKERNRLYEMMRDKNVLFLSGDRHVGGFYEDEDGGLLGEVTASSWTHTQPFGAFNDCSSAKECDEEDPRRSGNFVRVNHFGTVDIDWTNRVLSVALRRAESSYGAAYIHGYYKHKRSDAGQVLAARNITF